MKVIKRNAQTNTYPQEPAAPITSRKEGESNQTQEPKTIQKIQKKKPGLRKIKVVRKKTEQPKITKVIKISRKVKQPAPRKKVRTNIDNKESAEKARGQGESVGFGRQMMEIAGFAKRKKR
jgi:hypothetical protein